MVKPILLLLLLLFFISATRNIESANAQEQKTWCVAKPSSDETVLKQNIEFACSDADVDCMVIENGWSCSLPNTLINHASVVMNIYYMTKGRNSWDCNFGNSGLIVLTDPSYGSCIYS